MNHNLFFKFNWSQAVIVATRFINLPYFFHQNDTNEDGNPIFSVSGTAGADQAKLEIFLPNGSSRWMDFSLDCTVDKINQTFCAIFPTFGSGAHLLESSHGRSITKLKPNWTVQDLLIRSKYATEYQITFVPEENIEPLTSSSFYKLHRLNSIIINQFQCKRNNKYGTLFVLQTHILHVAKLFGLSSRSQIAYSDVASISLDKAKMTIESKQPAKINVYKFKNAAICESTTQLIQSLLDNKLESVVRSNSNKEKTQSEPWAVIVKNYRVLQPSIIDIQVGDIILIVSLKPRGELFPCSFKGTQVMIPKDYFEVLPNNFSSKSSVHSLLQKAGYKNIIEMPSQTDWTSLFLGGKLLKFHHGETIVLQGTKLQRIYQIISGYCSVETTIPKTESEKLMNSSKRWQESLIQTPAPYFYDRIQIRTLSPGETFGEVGLLLGTGATASVIAKGNPDEPDVTCTSVFMIEVNHLQNIFESNPSVASRFARYILTVIERRIRYETENRVFDFLGVI